MSKYGKVLSKMWAKLVSDSLPYFRGCSEGGVVAALAMISCRKAGFIKEAKALLL